MKKHRLAPDGTKFGDPIPDSKLRRAFCNGCGAPMQITEKKLKANRRGEAWALIINCGECVGGGVPAAYKGLTERQRHGLRHTES